jgi:hypothetical protein
MGYRDNVNPRTSNQNNTSSTTSELSTAGDMLIANSNGVPVALSVGLNNQTLKVSGGVPAWKNSYPESFKISYTSFADAPAFNATWNDTGVPFDQVHLGRYQGSHSIKANFKNIATTTGAIETVSTSAQGGLTAGNLTTYKNNTQELWCELTCADFTDIQLITNNLGTTGAQAITDITAFCSANVLSGIECKFSDMGSWTAGAFITNLNTWLSSLKDALTAGGCSLSLVLPALTNATVLSAYAFDYSTFINNVDYIVIDYCYSGANNDYGYGFPKVPMEAITGGTYSDSNTGAVSGAVAFYADGAIGKFSSDVGNKMQKMIIKLPTTGFVHTNADADYTFSNETLTRNDVNEDATYATVESAGLRDPSGHLRWNDGTYEYCMPDEITLQRQVDAIRTILDKYELDNPNNNAPRREITLCHLGGNNPIIPRN